MRATQSTQIIRDALVAHAIRPVVISRRVTIEDTIKALRDCNVLRADNVARIVFNSFPERSRTPGEAATDASR